MVLCGARDIEKTASSKKNISPIKIWKLEWKSTTIVFGMHWTKKNHRQPKSSTYTTYIQHYIYIHWENKKKYNHTHSSVISWQSHKIPERFSLFLYIPRVYFNNTIHDIQKYKYKKSAERIEPIDLNGFLRFSILFHMQYSRNSNTNQTKRNQKKKKS